MLISRPYLRTLCHSFASEYIFFFVVKLVNIYESSIYKAVFLMAVIRKWQKVFSNDRIWVYLYCWLSLFSSPRDADNLSLRFENVCISRRGGTLLLHFVLDNSSLTRCLFCKRVTTIENIDEKKNEIYAQKNCGVENIFIYLQRFREETI